MSEKSKLETIIIIFKMLHAKAKGKDSNNLNWNRDTNSVPFSLIADYVDTAPPRLILNVISPCCICSLCRTFNQRRAREHLNYVRSDTQVESDN